MAEPMVLIKLRYRVFAESGEFVEMRGAGSGLDLAADDHGAAHAEGLQHVGHRFTELGTRDAHELGTGPGRVEERAEEIEQGALAARGAELEGGADVLEGRMIFWREEKGEAMVAQPGGGFFGPQFDAEAERFEHVGAASLRGDGAITVLGHGDTRGGGHERHSGRDVEGVEPVTARAADIEDLAGGDRLNTFN